MTQTSRQPAVVRRVHLADGQAMREFVLGLSGASRRSRFHGVLNGVSPSLLRRLISADGEQQAAWVACVWGIHGEEIVGEAVWSIVEPEQRIAEFAISVRDDWHGHGIADELMGTLLKAARESGLRELYGDVLEANARMLAFMRRHGLHPDVCEPPAEPGIVRVGCLFPASATSSDEPSGARQSWLVRLTSRWS